MQTIKKTRALKIGDVSKQTGVKIETIRYYERIGVVPEAFRSAGGSRLYDEAMVRRLAFVKRSRELGFSLDEIRAMLRLVDEGTLTCGEIHAMTSDHLKAVQGKIADLSRLERVLESMVAQCSRGDVPDCPIVDALNAGA